MTPVFREMRPEDRPGMEAFYRALGEESARFFNLNGGNERRTMDFFTGGRPHHRYYVAEADGVLAGHLFIWDTDTAVPWLGVAVRDDWQGRGLGSFMLRELFGLLRGQGYGGVLLRTAPDNAPARRLYERAGFELLGEHPSGECLYLKRFGREEARA